MQNTQTTGGLSNEELVYYELLKDSIDNIKALLKDSKSISISYADYTYELNVKHLWDHISSFKVGCEIGGDTNMVIRMEDSLSNLSSFTFIFTKYPCFCGAVIVNKFGFTGQRFGDKDVPDKCGIIFDDVMNIVRCILYKRKYTSFQYILTDNGFYKKLSEKSKVNPWKKIKNKRTFSTCYFYDITI